MAENASHKTPRRRFGRSLNIDRNLTSPHSAPSWCNLSGVVVLCLLFLYQDVNPPDLYISNPIQQFRKMRFPQYRIIVVREHPFIHPNYTPARSRLLPNKIFFLFPYFYIIT